mgnify:CR=1 FL=1
MKILKIYIYNLHRFKLLKIFSFTINILFIGQLLYIFVKKYNKTSKSKKKFRHFNINSSYMSYWYATRVENLIKYKDKFYSNFIGHKNYKLGNFWHYNMFGMKFFFNNGCLAIIYCYIFFVISTFAIIFNIHNNFLVFILFILVCFNNEILYNLFERQNYNIFGLILVPFLYFSILHDNTFLSYSIFFLISYFSFTLSFINCVCLLILFIFNLDYNYLIMIMFPIAIYLINIFNLNKNNFIKSIFYNMEAVGLKKNNKYKFKTKPKFNDYLFIIFNICFLFSSGNDYQLLNLALITSLIIFFFNQVIRNFADYQNLRGQILMINSVILIINPSDASMVIFFITFSLINLDYLYILSFKNFYRLEQEVIRFVSKVPKNNTVLLVKKKNTNNNPDAFGNTRHYIDIFLYFFSKRKILMIPDFNTIFSDYNEKFVWGNTEKEISINLIKNKTNYFLLERKQKSLPKYLNSKKYKIISFFNFDDKINIITPKPFDKINLLLIKSKK